MPFTAAWFLFSCSKITGDIEKNAAGLISSLSLQADCLGHLDAQLNHVKFQLQLVKATHATVELNKLRAPVATVEAKPAVAQLERPVVSKRCAVTCTCILKFVNHHFRYSTPMNLFLCAQCKHRILFGFAHTPGHHSSCLVLHAGCLSLT